MPATCTTTEAPFAGWTSPRGPAHESLSSLSASDPSEVACDPKALVVQAPKLLEFPARETWPLAKERCEPFVARDALHHKLVLMKNGKVRGKLSHTRDVSRAARGQTRARSEGCLSQRVSYGSRQRQ